MESKTYKKRIFFASLVDSVFRAECENRWRPIDVTGTDVMDLFHAMSVCDINIGLYAEIEIDGEYSSSQKTAPVYGRL